MILQEALRAAPAAVAATTLPRLTPPSKEGWMPFFGAKPPRAEKWLELTQVIFKYTSNSKYS